MLAVLVGVDIDEGCNICVVVNVRLHTPLPIDR